VDHGGATRKAKSPEYIIWIALRQRCKNPRSDAYAYYGGRGIKVCDRWDEFAAFLEDMGPRPSPRHSIDRWPNPNGDYEPGNCRWATRKEQANNTRRNILVSVRGDEMTLKQAVEKYGGYYPAVIRKIRQGVSVEIALGLEAS
jgi:hypothetical protein